MSDNFYKMNSFKLYKINSFKLSITFSKFMAYLGLDSSKPYQSMQLSNKELQISRSKKCGSSIMISSTQMLWIWWIWKQSENTWTSVLPLSCLSIRLCLWLMQSRWRGSLPPYPSDRRRRQTKTRGWCRRTTTRWSRRHCRALRPSWCRTPHSNQCWTP